MTPLRHGCAAGYECLAARADLLDRINVFPVADGDTGANLRISLAPLRDRQTPGPVLLEQLARCAVGNSGNIAAAFFGEFLQAKTTAELARYADQGRQAAWRAVAAPRRGTMLSVFDRLATVLAVPIAPDTGYDDIGRALQEPVLASTRLLPDLESAGVVDSGALGMFVFFEAFFATLDGRVPMADALADLFPGRLDLNPLFAPPPSADFCVSAVLRPHQAATPSATTFAGLGESLVVAPGPAAVRIHVHTPDPEQLRTDLAVRGEILQWIDEAIGRLEPAPRQQAAIHLMTDAAGSLPRATARHYGLTLLDSYIVTDDQARPESLCAPEEIYRRLRAGIRVTTAQASTFERHQQYRSVCEQFGPTLYLCVGSAFTGNHAVALAWKTEHDPDNHLTVIDTGAASGRLAVIAHRVARFTSLAGSASDIIAFARDTVAESTELVFIDTLRYLVAGGRVSKAGGFLGDLLQLKPVITPTASGVRKVGMVRNREGQAAFALRELTSRFTAADRPLVLLQYSDNEAWVAGVFRPRVERLLPQAEILLSPLSLTSGVHMGPGTWAVAMAPAIPA